jgi:hypothetical protein
MLTRIPARNEPDTAAPDTATARARAAGSANACRTRASAEGSITAPAHACTTRPPTRTGSVGASPHAADATANTASPHPKTRCAPSRSDTAPAEMSSAANGTV